MDKIRITMTNGASAKDISDAIGQFLDQQEDEKASKEKDVDEIEEA